MGTAEAAWGGHLEVMKWAREHGCPWVEVDDVDAEYIMICCAGAAVGGHLEVLKWLREHDCPWDACTVRAPQGMGIWSWAREHGCLWDAETTKSAAVGGHLEVLRWARERG